MKMRIVLLIVLLCHCMGQGFAQEAVSDSTVHALLAAGDSTAKEVVHSKMKLEPFKPDPNKAVLYAIVPGLGQIYNRKYWKLPIVYGGLMGCMYAVTWNNRMYGDYSTGYMAMMDDYAKFKDTPTDQLKEEDFNPEWVNLIPASYSPKDKFKDAQLQDALKRRKDYYRRYRDLSIIVTVGVYAISIIDAYVDAQLFDFDITPDLSMRVEPVVTPKTSFSSASYGVNWSLKF